MQSDIRYVFYFFVLLLIGSLNAQFNNPLTGNIDVHDPVIMREGDTYHVYWTGELIQEKTSVNRINWANRGSVLTKPSWVQVEVPKNSGTDYWAPDISFRDGRYWLYYSVSTFGTSVSAIGLATNNTLDRNSPQYKWTDCGMVIKSSSASNYNCIDPNAFTDTDGKLYLAFGSFWSGIKLIELDPSTGKPYANAPLVSLATRQAGIEAPFLLKWNGFYYLFVSFDKCCDGVKSTYKIAVGRSLKVNGPYIDKQGKDMLSGGALVIDSGDVRWKGPGHNAVFLDKDTVFCINHAYDAKANGAPEMMIRPLYWENGWPSFVNNASSIVVSAERKMQEKNKTINRIITINELKHINNFSKYSEIYTIRGEEISIAHSEKMNASVIFLRKSH